MTDYTDFVTTKLRAVPPVGITRQVELIDGLFPHQIDLVRWALRRGRAAIFADTGLGKTRMQVAWADVVQRETGGDLLILAPLAVAQQTVAEAAACGVTITHAHDASEVRPGINITNYDRLHKFDASRFVGVVLDESSVIKHHTSKTLQALLDAFSRTPYRLCATATPAPNDWTELGTHAEFLGIRSRAEMLAEFFVHDGGDTQTWRVKGHARQIFWRWVASWGVMLRSPADLGHDATAYNLPPLSVHQHTVESDHSQEETGYLFAMEAADLMERRNARKASLAARAAVKQSCYRAFTKSRLGGLTRKVMGELSRIQATTRAINEHASYKARQDISGTLFMREQQSALLTGNGTEEHLSLIHSWLGHLLYVAVQRIKRLARGSVAYQELRQNTLRLICRARRALVNVWRRYVDTQRIGFKGQELWAFRTGYDEAELFAGHTSRAEMRAAFDYASDMCKRKGYKIIESSYQC